MILRVSDSMLESSSDPSRVVSSLPRNRFAGRIDVVGEGERLVDRLDVLGLGVAWVLDGDRLPVDHGSRPTVGRVGAGQHPHQGRLAGAVAADETDDLPCVEVDADVADGMDATERDVDVAHLDDGRSLRDGHGLVLHVAHDPRRRFRVSRPTATIRTMPATTFWPGEFTPRKLKP